MTSATRTARPTGWAAVVRLLDRLTLTLFNPQPVLLSVARHDFRHRR